jgi:hypothetical protein
VSEHLRVRNWERFQHYKKRRPPWVKLYDELLDDEEMTAMPKEARLLFPLVLLVAARKNNRIPNDSRWLATELALPLADVRKGLGALLASGHVVNGASASAPEMLSPETEAETNE